MKQEKHHNCIRTEWIIDCSCYSSSKIERHPWDKTMVWRWHEEKRCTIQITIHNHVHHKKNVKQNHGHHKKVTLIGKSQKPKIISLYIDGEWLLHKKSDMITNRIANSLLPKNWWLINGRQDTIGNESNRKKMNFWYNRMRIRSGGQRSMLMEFEDDKAWALPDSTMR